MIIQLLAGVLAITGLTLLLRSLWLRSNLSRGQTWATVGAAALVAALIGLAATGRLHWVFAAGAALLPFGRRALGMLRFVPMLNHLFPGWQHRFRSGSKGAQDAGSGADSGYASAETPHLKMSLHQASGHIDGEILSGRHRGRLLSELALADILELHHEVGDPDSRRLLETYLDRTSPDWRNVDPRNGRARDGTHGREPGGQPGTMDRSHALDVLGLDESATEKQIIEAHRRLIQKLHPDRGGSTYLAATLNEAKRTLLES